MYYELAFQAEEREKRALELLLANIELDFQNAYCQQVVGSTQLLAEYRNDSVSAMIYPDTVHYQHYAKS